MALSESALSDLLASLQAGDGVDLVRELARWALQELIEVEAAAAIGAGRYERTDGRVTERNGHRPRVRVDEGRRSACGDPEAARRVVLPVAARAAPAHRPGPVRGGDGGLRGRRVDPRGRRSGRSDGHGHRDLEVGGVDGSVPASTNASPRSATAPSATSGSRTSTSTPPTSTSATTPSVRSCPAPSSSPPGSPLVATGRSSASTSATARTRRSGPGSCARCAPAGWAGCASSSPTPTPGCAPRSAGSCRARRGSAAASTTPATCSPSSPRRTRRWSPRRSGRSSRSPTPTSCEPATTKSPTPSRPRFPKAADSLRDARRDVLAFAVVPP